MPTGHSQTEHRQTEHGQEGTTAMTLFWAVVAYVLYLYILIVLARMVVETTRQFARSWRPAGVAAIGVELVYLATDPPLRVLRRLIPPVQLGSVRLDLSIIILLLAILGLQWIALALG
jgi:YggT family protein